MEGRYVNWLELEASEAERREILEGEIDAELRRTSPGRPYTEIASWLYETRHNAEVWVNGGYY